MNKISIKSLFFVFLLIGTMLPLLFVSAESQINVQEEEIGVEMIPENPEPYETVVINLSSYATNLNKAIISWQSNSGMVLSGIGKKSYSFTAPGPDSSIYFDISITPAGSVSSIKKRVVITTSDLDIFWESVDGYTPPFYRGRSLPTRGSIIKAVAIPNTKTINRGIGDIEYTWSKKDKTDESLSGYNKNSYVFKNSLFDKENNISVLLSSVSNNYSARKNVSIPLYNPVLFFYKETPSEGILYNNKISNDYTMLQNEETFISSPYFLNILGKDYLFNYQWTVNGKIINTPTKKSEITISPEEKNGYAEIGLSIINESELYQDVINNFRVNF